MPASSRGYVNRAVTGNEQISPASPRADVGIGPYENAAEVLSARGDAHCQDPIIYKMFRRFVYTPRVCKFSSNRIVLSPERSEKASTPVPLAPTDLNAQMFRRDACTAPHPSGLRPATFPQGKALRSVIEKAPPPGVRCTWEGEYLTAPSGARCGGRRGRGWGISPVCPAAYRKSEPVCSAH